MCGLYFFTDSFIDSHPLTQHTQSSRPNFRAVVRTQFRQNAASVTPKDISGIEYLLRRGKRQLDVLKSPSVVDIGGSVPQKSP